MKKALVLSGQFCGIAVVGILTYTVLGLKDVAGGLLRILWGLIVVVFSPLIVAGILVSFVVLVAKGGSLRSMLAEAADKLEKRRARTRLLESLGEVLEQASDVTVDAGSLEPQEIPRRPRRPARRLKSPSAN
jgi:hypothetical protein